MRKTMPEAFLVDGKILRLLLLICLLASPLAQAGDQAAIVIRTQNQVEAISGQTSRELVRKDPVFSGEQVSTAATSSVSMRFTDGSVVTLDPATLLNISEYRFEDEGSQSNSLILELASGSFRSLTGAISKVNPDAYKVKTPLASLSIRGTDYVADFDPANRKLYVYVWQGQVIVQNEFGSVSLAAGEGAITLDGKQPVRSDPVIPSDTRASTEIRNEDLIDEPEEAPDSSSQDETESRDDGSLTDTLSDLLQNLLDPDTISLPDTGIEFGLPEDEDFTDPGADPFDDQPDFNSIPDEDDEGLQDQLQDPLPGQ